MITKPIDHKKIAVVVENKFIPEEFEAYRCGFALAGAEVEYISRIFYGDYKPGHPDWKDPEFYSDVDPSDNEPWETPHKLKFTLDEAKKSKDFPVLKDVSQIKPNDYAAIIMSANYTSVRLRWENLPDKLTHFEPYDYVKSPPVVKFFADSMENKTIVKGALCHGLWVLTPNPNLLKGRKVTCHPVVMADILNCEAEIMFNENGFEKVYVDDDLVTGLSKHETLDFIEAIAQQIIKLNS